MRSYRIDGKHVDSPDPKSDMLVITDDSTKADIAEALGWACQSAKRQQHIVEKFSDDEPTAWTRMHRRINRMLEDWEKAPA